MALVVSDAYENQNAGLVDSDCHEVPRETMLPQILTLDPEVLKPDPTVPEHHKPHLKPSSFSFCGGQVSLMLFTWKRPAVKNRG